MGDDTQDFVKSCWHNLVCQFRNHTKETLRCRACGNPSAWFSDMCENCGTQDPVVLPMKYLWTASVLAVILLLLAVWWL
jgi:hypothetical protein